MFGLRVLRVRYARDWNTGVHICLHVGIRNVVIHGEGRDEKIVYLLDSRQGTRERNRCYLVGYKPHKRS